MTCHIHPGTNMVATYFGYTWWDNETDGDKMYPTEAARSHAGRVAARRSSRNPEGRPLAGMWADVKFLEKTGTPEFNKDLQHTQFADFHGHGWVFRAVYKRDRKGNLLDERRQDRVVSTIPRSSRKAVHLKDIHLEKGMHCVDCHFEQDNHGNGKLYGETRNAVEIDCVDCHGTIDSDATPDDHRLRRRPTGGTDSRRLAHAVGAVAASTGRTASSSSARWWTRTSSGRSCRSLDTITPGNAHYSEKSRLAKTIQKDGSTWGDRAATRTKLAHSNSA